MTRKTYEQGVADGKIEALEKIQGKHEQRLNHHSERLRITERILYAVIGVGVFMQLYPSLQKLFN